MAGKLTADSIEDGAANVGSTTDMIKGSAKAYCNFNGTLADIGSSLVGYNVLSITDGGTGIYTVTFSNVMPDTNYTAVAVRGASSQGHAVVSNTNKLAGSIELKSYADASSSYPLNDDANMSLAVFR